MRLLASVLLAVLFLLTTLQAHSSEKSWAVLAGVNFHITNYTGRLGDEVKDSTLEGIPVGLNVPGFYLALGPRTLFGASGYFTIFKAKQTHVTPFLNYEMLELRANAELWQFLWDGWGHGGFLRLSGGYSNLGVTITQNSNGAELEKRNYHGTGWVAGIGVAVSKGHLHTPISLNYGEYGFDGIKEKIYSVDFALLY